MKCSCGQPIIRTTLDGLKELKHHDLTEENKDSWVIACSGRGKDGIPTAFIDGHVFIYLHALSTNINFPSEVIKTL